MLIANFAFCLGNPSATKALSHQGAANGLERVEQALGLEGLSPKTQPLPATSYSVDCSGRAGYSIRE